MFDYGNTEACTSAILSLVSNLSLDYNCHYEAAALTSYLIDNYGVPSCFSTLISTIQAGYKEYISNDQRYNRYGQDIELKVAQLKHVIESIENYLCYIYNSQQNSDQFISIVDALVTQTFAFYLGEDKQKQSLVTIFRMIANKIISDVKPEKAAYFAKSLYGIDVSSRVLSWVDENIESLEDSSREQLLDAIANLFTQLFPEKVKLDFDTLIAILRQWIAGLPYVEIFNNHQEELPINQIEKLCSNTFSYHFCFLLGNILDAIGDRAEELTEQLALLQKMVKYGVPSRFQILVCENLFDDRIIAKHLEMLVGQIFLTDKELKNYMTTKRNEVLQTLKSYPDYFSYKFRMYVR